MLSYSMPMFGSLQRQVYYQGARWIHVIQAPGYWSDKPGKFAARPGWDQWTNVRQGLNGVPRNYDRRLVPNRREVV